MEDIMLDKEEVLHVAHLARIEVTDEEIVKYQKDLKILLDEVDKIKDIEDYDEDKMIFPVKNELNYQKEMTDVKKEDILLNVPKKMGNFVEAPVMINE